LREWERGVILRLGKFQAVRRARHHVCHSAA
jgi:hypothetical protein